MGRVYIGLGSNLGDGRSNLQEAWRRLGEVTGVALLAISCPYLTKPVAKPEWLTSGREMGEGLFTNAVGLVESALPPLVLLARMQAIENAMGRDRSLSVDRAVDLDLLYYEDQLHRGGDLLLPHPEMQFRSFVLVPLAELAPDLVHPTLGLTTTQMLQRLGDFDAEEIQRLTWAEGHDLKDSASPLPVGIS